MERIDRRSYLALLAGGALAVAGCSGDAEPPEATPVGAPDRTRPAGVATGEGQNVPTDTAERPADRPADPRVGDRVELGALHAVVSGAGRVGSVAVPPDDSPTAPEEETLEAPPGGAFAVVDLAVEHVGSGVVDLDETLTVALTDGSGETYERVPALAPVVRPLVAGRLASGEVVRGDLVYAVPADAEGLVLELESAGETAAVATDRVRPAGARAVLEQDFGGGLAFSSAVDRAGVEVRVATLERGNDLVGYFGTEEGYEVVSLGVVFENHSGRDRTVAPGQAQLKDATGRVHEADPEAVGPLVGLVGTTVADGDEHEGSVVYRVPEGAPDLYWVFDFGEWGADRREFWRLR
jgi:hypothetical protein